MPAARHDGTEVFPVEFAMDGGGSWACIYYPVPGGVVMEPNGGATVFIPMTRLVFERDATGVISDVRLESTMAQLMLAGAAASMALVADVDGNGG